MSLGERIREAARRVGGQKALGALLGVDQKTVGRYVGGREPSLKVLNAIAEHCGVSLYWLVTGKDVEQAPIDLDVLKKCIAETEREEDQRGVQIDPENKALVIATLYKTILANLPAAAEDEPVATDQGERN